MIRALVGRAMPIDEHRRHPHCRRSRDVCVVVVADVRHRSLGADPGPTFYWSMHKFLFGPMYLVVRFAAPQPGEGGNKEAGSQKTEDIPKG